MNIFSSILTLNPLKSVGYDEVAHLCASANGCTRMKVIKPHPFRGLSARTRGFSQIFGVGLLLVAAIIVSSVRAEPPSDLFRDLSGAHVVNFTAKTTVTKDGDLVIESHETKARLWVPYRKGRVTLRANLGSTRLFIEGRIDTLRTKKRLFGIGKLLYTRGKATIQSGPPDLTGISDGFNVSALAYKGRAFPWGNFYISNYQGASIYGEFEHPGLKGAYRRSDRERELDYQKLNGEGQQLTGRGYQLRGQITD